jgi:phage tail protein X
MIIEETVRTEGLTVSRLVWAFLQKQPPGYIEKVLDLNPGLSADPFIPVGTVIKLPVEESFSEAPETVIRLWD